MKQNVILWQKGHQETTTCGCFLNNDTTNYASTLKSADKNLEMYFQLTQTKLMYMEAKSVQSG